MFFLSLIKLNWTLSKNIYLLLKGHGNDADFLGFLPSRRIGESFFDNEYLREFEAKIGTAQKVVLGIYEEPVFCKNPRKSASLPCPFNI